MTDPRAYTGQRSHTFTTFTGKSFSFLDPDPETVCLEDIAHSASITPRYNGHLLRPYSVAQHSVYVMQQMTLLMGETGSGNPRWLLAALLHDAAETYTGDIISPLKSMLLEFRVIEDRVHRAVCRHFNIPEPGVVPEMDALIHEADMRVFAGEWVYFAGRGPGTFVGMNDPTLYDRRYKLPDETSYWSHTSAEATFAHHVKRLIRLSKVGAQ